MNRLNWGCAFNVEEGWINSDLIDFGQEHVGDILDGLPYEDNYFDYIVANHSLQMIRFEDLPQALNELKRVLKPQGVLRILVPDARKAMVEVRRGHAGYFPIADELAPTHEGKYLRYLFWHGDARSAFTRTTLCQLLVDVGFANAAVCEFKFSPRLLDGITDLDSREQESLIVEGYK